MTKPLPDGSHAVSVPLPGFSGLRRRKIAAAVLLIVSFSPVAGIQWVETTVKAGGGVA